MMKKPSRLHWLLPLLFALPFLAAGALALALYGQKLYDLVMIALKLVVIALKSCFRADWPTPWPSC